MNFKNRFIRVRNRIITSWHQHWLYIYSHIAFNKEFPPALFNHLQLRPGAAGVWLGKQKQNLVSSGGGWGVNNVAWWWLAKYICSAARQMDWFELYTNNGSAFFSLKIYQIDKEYHIQTWVTTCFVLSAIIMNKGEWKTLENFSFY